MKPIVFVTALTLGCGANATKTVKCTDPVRKVMVQKDCQSYYETTVKTQMVDISADVSALAGATVGGGFIISNEVTKLAQDYDNLLVQQMTTLIALCETRSLDACSVDSGAQQDLIIALNDKFLEARTALVTGTAIAKSAKAGEAEAVAELETKVGTAETALAEVEALLASATR